MIKGRGALTFSPVEHSCSQPPLPLAMSLFAIRCPPTPAVPQAKRNGLEEYKNQHIRNSIFFDLDANSKKETNLPHMLVDQKSWEQIISKMGIKNEDEIVVYDNSDVISSCRCWFNFIYFGHNPKLVHVLNGGLKKWIKENKEVTNEATSIKISNYKSFEKKRAC